MWPSGIASMPAASNAAGTVVGTSGAPQSRATRDAVQASAVGRRRRRAGRRTAARAGPAGVVAVAHGRALDRAGDAEAGGGAGGAGRGHAAGAGRAVLGAVAAKGLGRGRAGLRA